MGRDEVLVIAQCTAIKLDVGKKDIQMLSKRFEIRSQNSLHY